MAKKFTKNSKDSNKEKPFSKWQHVIAILGVFVAIFAAGVLWFKNLQVKETGEAVSVPTAINQFKEGCGNVAVAGNQKNVEVTITDGCTDSKNGVSGE